MDLDPLSPKFLLLFLGQSHRYYVEPRGLSYGQERPLQLYGPLQASLNYRLVIRIQRFYPCRCACLALEQIILTTPLRLITRQLLHLGLTDADTFMLSAF